MGCGHVLLASWLLSGVDSVRFTRRRCNVRKIQLLLLTTAVALLLPLGILVVFSLAGRAVHWLATSSASASAAGAGAGVLLRLWTAFGGSEAADAGVHRRPAGHYCSLELGVACEIV